MDYSYINVKGLPIYAKGISVKATKDGPENTRLLIEFYLVSEPEHLPPFSADEKDRNREFKVDSDLTSDDYNVTVAQDTPTTTKFTIQTKFSTKLPGTGPSIRQD